MRKAALWIVLVIATALVFGCWQINRSVDRIFDKISMDLMLTPGRTVMVITPNPTEYLGLYPAPDDILGPYPVPPKGPVTIATALLDASPTPTPAPSHTPAPTSEPDLYETALNGTFSAARATNEALLTERAGYIPTPTPATPAINNGRWLPTGVPDYIPGGGIALMNGTNPYQVSLNPGGWQAFMIEDWSQGTPFLVDVTPLEPTAPLPEGTAIAETGAFIEWKILPIVLDGHWVDALWLKGTGVWQPIDLRIDLIPVGSWETRYDASVTLQPGDWMGFGMFSNEEGCGGVLSIKLDSGARQPEGAYIYNTRLQPEFPGPEWVQVARVQLWGKAVSQPARLRYYIPGAQAQELLRLETTLAPGTWNAFQVTSSLAEQAYLVEVVPVETSDNEVAFSVVRPEFDGTSWQDVLRVYVPEGRPPLPAVVRVLGVRD